MNLFRKIWVFFIDTVQTFFVAITIFLFIYIFLFRPFEVNGASMYPNFKDSEYVLTNLISLRLETLKRGDVIVFKAPADPDKDFIKRIIGLPGDTVEVLGGSIYVDNKKLDEHSYLDQSIRTYGGAFLKEGVTVKVPQDQYFVMGDNRLLSSDSREWGFVPKSSVIGKSMFVYWPPQDMKAVNNPFTM